MRRLTSSDLSLLENGQEASNGWQQQRHLVPPEHVLAAECKSTRRPTLKRAKAGQVGNLVSSGQWGAGGKGGLGVG